MSNEPIKASKHVLEPTERISEVLFGLIMVLTFTGSLSPAPSAGGLPLALGAAFACPNRKTVLLQSDGIGMNMNQALGSMARKKASCFLQVT